MSPGAIKRVGIYLRVSTADQSTSLQRGEIESYVAARGWNNLSFYEDKVTGTHGNRPMFKSLMADARQRKIDMVICWKLDRLFRSLKDLIATIQEFADLGIDFISLKDNIDLTTSAGRLMLHILAAFGEFEVSLIRERVTAGVRAAKAKGKTLGRPRKRNDEAILSLRAQGQSIRQISKTLSVSKGAIQRCLANVPKSPPNQRGKGQ